MLLPALPVLWAACDSPRRYGASTGIGAGPRPAPLLQHRPPTLELTFVGDIMAHTPHQRMPAPELIYREVSGVLQSDDLTFANLEFPIDDAAPQATYPSFNAHSPFARAAVEAGVDVLSVANNHSFDQGLPGVVGTRRALAAITGQVGRPWISGIRSNPSVPFVPTLIEHRGWVIGYLAATQHANLKAGAEPYVHIVDYDDAAQVERFLSGVRAAAPSFDLLIVSYHGGVELAATPEPAKLAFFEGVIRAGADIVHGHHPHVLQPVSRPWRAGSQKLIMSSTGNLISGMAMPVGADAPDDRRAPAGDSALFRVTVEWGRAGADVSGVTQQLITNYRDPSGNVVIGWLARVATDVPPPWRPFYAERLRQMERRYCPPCSPVAGQHRWLVRADL